MAFRIFTVRPHDAEALSELNAFTSGHRVVRVDRHLVRAETDPALVFVVEFTASGAPGPSAKKPPRIDYKEVLDEEEFEAFSSLRDVRREIAEELGRPVFAIFSNAELAEMVQKRIHTREGLLGMSGVGEGRVEQHAEKFLPILAAWAKRTGGGE